MIKVNEHKILSLIDSIVNTINECKTSNKFDYIKEIGNILLSEKNSQRFIAMDCTETGLLHIEYCLDERTYYNAFIYVYNGNSDFNENGIPTYCSCFVTQLINLMKDFKQIATMTANNYEGLGNLSADDKLQMFIES